MASSTLTPTGITAKNITAHEDQYTVGGSINLTAAFRAVEGSIPTYISASTSFGTPELTDDHGRTYAFVNTSTDPVDVTSQVTNRYGVAELVVTLDTIDSVKLAALSSADKSKTITISAENYAKIIGQGSTAPTYEAADGTGNPYADADISLAFVIAADGSGATLNNVAGAATDTNNDQTNDAYQWVVKFYYAVAPKNSGKTAKDQTSEHGSDTITVSIS